MNKHAANAGDVVKHLVLAEVLDLERDRIRTYIDPYAGCPQNDLYERGPKGPKYGFATRSERTKKHGRPWADRYVEMAYEGLLGRDVLNARYTALLQGGFWGSGSLSPRPIYPGSVAIAIEVGTGISEWHCGETDREDRRRLRGSLPAGAHIAKRLIRDDGSPMTPALRHAIDATAMVFVDPFNLTRATDARRFVVTASEQGALVMAWYPLFRPWTPKAIQKLWRQLPPGTEAGPDPQMLEVNWSTTESRDMSGVGMLLVNLSSGLGTMKRLGTLSQHLRRLFGSGWTLSHDPRARPS